MVELTDITDESKNFKTPKEQQPAANDDKAGDLSDDEYGSDFEDDYDENETIADRLVALKDIIPPKQRQNISTLFNTASSLVKSFFSKSGNVAWTVTTSALLLGVPLSLSILGEQQLIEMEKSFDLQKDANDLLAQGDNNGQSAPATA
ncbi:hypothetical protein ZYGR_0AD00110 [Zygosaccharomyces rouxii]|uniref:Mitochondrial import receptor subunit TOM22 n=1 Tax=Zygosaccharomyces rouxii TaxID=4956 RepID=A0A1Q3A589_ZYGRO|nr:hypothetical protein ZYGR_0AD00110 [Zygosaccharomyces rouxii]